MTDILNREEAVLLVVDVQAKLVPAIHKELYPRSLKNMQIVIEAAGLNGKAIRGRSFAEAKPIIGDQFWTPVTWKEHDDLGVKKGEPVMLRVRMSGVPSWARREPSR